MIYADPPWLYDFAARDHRNINNHYPAMPTEEICNMPISDICEKDCVLFLWATAPKLPEGLQVLEAWGFDYKTHFIWDKVKHNFGHYNSVRHEILLIGGKGSSTPDVKKLYDSVVVCEKTKHSEKPEIFREMIDELYLSKNKIELFARKKTQGWFTYGNET